MADPNPIAKASAECQKIFTKQVAGSATGNCPVDDDPPPDVVIPIVYPDYLVTVDNISLMQKMAIGATPGVSIESEVKTSSGTRAKVKGLGHAGVILINGRSGAVEYWEYGRYDPPEKGWVRSKPVPSVTMGPDKRPTRASLEAALAKVAAAGGHGTRISAVYVEVPEKFAAMQEYVKKREMQNPDPKRKPYDLQSHNCFTFALQVAQVAGVDVSTASDLFPSSNMKKLQNAYPSINYDPATGKADTKVPLK